LRAKIKIKQLLFNAGLWYPLNRLRRIPEILRWFRTGHSGAAPHPVKMLVVESYLKKFRLDYFLETGTYLGETLGYIARRGLQCISIELSPELCRQAQIRFKHCKNIKLFQGDSSQILPGLLGQINKPVLFWLDGHYSGGITATAETHTPINAELKAILGHPVKQHVILIDDAHCFDGTNDYPYLDDLLRLIREDGCYSVEVSMDIIRLTPKKG